MKLDLDDLDYCIRCGVVFNTKTVKSKEGNDCILMICPGCGDEIYR